MALDDVDSARIAVLVIWSLTQPPRYLALKTIAAYGIREVGSPRQLDVGVAT